MADPLTEEEQLRQKAVDRLEDEKRFMVKSRDGAEHSVPYSQLAEQVAQGGLVKKGTRVPMMSPEGKLGSVPIEQFQVAMGEHGYQPASAAQVNDGRLEGKYGTAEQMAYTALEAGARSLTTLGIADPQDMPLFGDAADAAARASENTKTRIAADLGVTLGTAFLTGGATAEARVLAGGTKLATTVAKTAGAAAKAKGLAAEAGALSSTAKAAASAPGLVSRVANLNPITLATKGGARLEGALARKFGKDAPGFLAKGAAVATSGAIEGALYGTAVAAKETYTNPEFTSEAALEQIKMHTLFGAGVGTGLHVGMGAIKGVAWGANKGIRRMFNASEGVSTSDAILNHYTFKSVAGDTGGTAGMKKIMRRYGGTLDPWAEKFRDADGLKEGFGPEARIRSSGLIMKDGVEQIQGPLNRAVEAGKDIKIGTIRNAIMAGSKYKALQKSQLGGAAEQLDWLHKELPTLFGESVNPKSTMSVKEAWQLRVDIDQAHAWRIDPTTSKNALLMRDIRPDLEEVIEDGIEKALGAGERATYRKGKELYHVGVTGRDLAMDNMARDKARSGTGLLDSIYSNMGAMVAAAGGGAMSGSMLVGILTGQMHHAWRANKAEIIGKTMHGAQRWWNAEANASSLMQRSVKAAAGAMKAAVPTRATVRVTAQLGAREKKREDVYKEMRQKYSEAASNPLSVMERMNNQMADLEAAAPELMASMRDKTIRAAVHLNETAPVANTPIATARPDLQDTLGVPDSEQLKWLNRVVAVENPQAVIDAVENLTVTREQMETFATVWPARHAQLLEHLGEELASAEKPPSRYQTQMLSLVFGRPFDPSYQPKRVANFQEQYVLQAAQREEEQPSPSRRNQPKTAAAHLTKSQKTSEAASHLA